MADKHIMIKINLGDFKVLEEISKNMRLPISTLARLMIIENKEFQEMHDELSQSEMDELTQTEFLDRLGESFKTE